MNIPVDWCHTESALTHDREPSDYMYIIYIIIFDIFDINVALEAVLVTMI